MRSKHSYLFTSVLLSFSVVVVARFVCAWDRMFTGGIDKTSSFCCTPTATAKRTQRQDVFFPTHKQVFSQRQVVFFPTNVCFAKTSRLLSGTQTHVFAETRHYISETNGCFRKTRRRLSDKRVFRKDKTSIRFCLLYTNDTSGCFRKEDVY